MTERLTLQHTCRTTVAAVASLMVARLLGLPEAYWAAVTSLVVMQSTLGASVNVSARRFIGTVLGGTIGAQLTVWFGPNTLAFGAGIFLLGVVCLLAARAHPRLPEYLERSTYRFGGIALAVVMLVARSQSAWIAALHRIIELSLGILVSLLVTLIWPERSGQTKADSRRAGGRSHGLKSNQQHADNL